MHQLLDPAILFFVLGLLAGLLRSNLEVPRPIAKFLSLYLLMAIGLKGGFALAESGLTLKVAASLGLAMLMALVVPSLGYLFLRNQVNRFDAAALAAAYGSVSAITFVTAVQFVENQGLVAGGHMAVAMVLMETPAILFALAMANALRRRQAAPATALARAETAHPHRVGAIVRESLTDGTQILLLGSMAVGILSGKPGEAMMQPFSGDLFKGMLAFFLLDMGLLVASNLGVALRASRALLAYATLAPLTHAGLALAGAWLLGLSAGDAALLMVLSASASYIVVPAVLRTAIPEANPALYLGLSLGITFPLNLIAGIPLYTYLARVVLPG